MTPGTTSQKKRDHRGLTCVMLHGFGVLGDELVGQLAPINAPGTAFVFPEAPRTLQDFTSRPMFGEARGWWMLDLSRLERAVAAGEMPDLSRDTSRDIPEGLADARAAVTEMLDALAKEAPEQRLVLGGFSQGAKLALDVALRDPARPIAGLVLLSGSMLAEQEWRPLMPARRGTPVFLSHGEADPLLPFAIAERLHDALTSAGLDVTFAPFSGPHAITRETVDRLGAWLRRRA